MPRPHAPRPAGDAIALARALRRLPSEQESRMSSSAVTAAETLNALGADCLDPTAFAASGPNMPAAPAPQNRRREGGEGGPPRLPPLLAAALAAQA